MTIGLLKESEPEKRVALLPEAVKVLTGQGHNVIVEQGAGSNAFQQDNQYKEAEARIGSRDEVLSSADLIISINTPSEEDLRKVPEKTVLIAVFKPLQDTETTELLRERQLSAFSMDLLPRTTRAQAMDILSSMATVAGYKAVLLAAGTLPSFFPMFMTAAGTISPSKVLVLGAGVAGLQAIATARRLGAVVHVFDVRAAVKEEVMSLGGKFVEVEGARDDVSAGGYAVEQQEEYLQKQRQAIHDQAVKSNVIICTAQIPGKKAPVLIWEDTLKAMKPGSVVVDLAASSGGNCEGTEDDQTVVKHGITIIGDSNLPSDMPVDASQMFGKNVLNFLKILLNKEGIKINFEDDILYNSCICHEGAYVSPRIQSIFESKS
jgi:H+-translocating NAD(P) transhydrogenase subunit alpha